LGRSSIATRPWRFGLGSKAGGFPRF
jgi:hypothetical protein